MPEVGYKLIKELIELNNVLESYGVTLTIEHAQILVVGMPNFENIGVGNSDKATACRPSSHWQATRQQRCR